MNIKNNHIRPESDWFNLDNIRQQAFRFDNVSLEYKNGKIASIQVSDDAFATYMRVLHHLERYEFAAQLLNNKKTEVDCVIDIGIANGYGISAFCKLLNHSTPTVTGVEIDPSIMKECQAKHPEFTVLSDDILALNCEDTFDVITCFELLGNSSLVTDEALMDKIKSLLSPKGVAFLSIAIFDESEHGRARKKDYSERIYSAQSFQSLFKKCFDSEKYRLSFFTQSYPLKRFLTDSDCIWPMMPGKHASDFAIAVIESL